MIYPYKLLPNKNYKLIDSDLGVHHLVRHTAVQDIQELQEESTGLIKAKYICSPRENIIDLSTNLLGIFDHDHLGIELTKAGKIKYMHYCFPDEQVNLPVFTEDFNLNSDRGFFHLLISDINNTLVKYKIGEKEFEAKCKVLHTPMKWNYWHFSIRWILTDQKYWNELDPRGKKKWSKRLAHVSRSHLQMFANLQIPRTKNLEEEAYVK